MITVDEALAHILERARPVGARLVPLEESLGLVLAADITSDVDSPPHDKSIVDGYAVIADDLRSGPAQLAILEEVVAGALPRAAVTSGSATRIMTGAPIPAGADAVVMIEQTALVDRHGSGLGAVAINDPDVRAGRNIVRRASVMRSGDVVLRRGVVVRPAEIGLLAEVGRAQVDVVPRPTVAVLPTGNELVDYCCLPAAGQIRNSNGPMLAAAARNAGAEPMLLPIARDDETDLRQKIATGLDADVLLLSGGVSAGVLDLVPRVLADLGAREVFHKVRLKPGKPLWFGTVEREDRMTLIFGLPGNPVSSFVCFELFVRPALARLRGEEAATGRRAQARLECDHQQRGDRQTFFPAKYRLTEAGESRVQPVAWQGSADLRGLVEANALVAFAPGDRLYAAGETVEVVLLSGW